MSKDIISTIIKGKKITGDDVGRLLLADMAEEYKTYFTTGQMKSIISQDEFNKLLNSLQNNFQIERYNRYVSIHNTIKTYLSLTRGTAKEFECRLELCKRLLSNIKTTIQAESIKNSMPLIVTEKQYKDLMDKYENFIRDDAYTYIDIFEHFITTQVSNYASAKENTPEELVPDAEVEALITKYRKEPVKNPELRRIYNSMFEASEDGYFRFKGLLTSLGDTREEFLHNCALQNIKPIEERVNEYSAKALKKPVDEVFLKDVLTPEDMEKNIKYELYSTPPDTVYKYDLLDMISEAYNIYTDDAEEQKEIINTFTLMCEELPELIELIKTRMSKYKCLKPYIEAKPKDMFNIKISGKDLLKEDVPDYRSWGLFNLREDYPRAYNGIAVIKEEILSRYDREYVINEAGEYKKEDEDIAFNNMIEDSFLHTVEQIGQEGKSFIPSLYDCLKEVNAFNEFVKIVAEVTNLPIVKEAFSYDTEKIELDIEEYNRLLKLLLLISIPQLGKNNGKYEEAIKMRDNIFKALPYIDTNRAEVTPEDREKGVEFISDLNNFKGISAVSKPFYILTGCGD